MKANQFYIKSLNLCIISILFAAFFGCTSIHDDLEPCKLYLQFKYDYNMLYADAFSSQVDKVEVFIFDSNGLFVKSVTQDGAPLKQDKYQMELQLSPGSYTAITWAGRHDSFTIPTLTAGTSKMSDLTLKLNYNDTKIWNTEMENLWYGTPVSFSFNPSAQEVVTLPLVKDNNRVRLIMKDLDATADNAETADNFDVKLTASNAFYDYQNQPIDNNGITYAPYFSSGDSFESVATELNTLRFIENKDYRLSICDKQTGKSILGDDMPYIDLKKYLLLTKMEYAKMSDQEYLDREYDWKIIIYYRKQQGIEGQYLAVKIIVNDWTVWTQDVDITK